MAFLWRADDSPLIVFFETSYQPISNDFLMGVQPALYTVISTCYTIDSTNDI